MIASMMDVVDLAGRGGLNNMLGLLLLWNQPAARISLHHFCCDDWEVLWLLLLLLDRPIPQTRTRMDTPIPTLLWWI
jgi:hypothetical protein